MNFRSIRAANQGLYLGTSLLVLAACAYTLWRGERPEWQLWLAGLAALITLAWGGYYALLRYQVDAQGVSRHSFFMVRERILWSELTQAEYEEHDSMGTARSTLRLHAQDGRGLTLTSDLLPPNALAELADDLRSQGLLPPKSQGNSPSESADNQTLP